MTPHRIPAQRPTRGSTAPGAVPATAEQPEQRGWAEVLRVSVSRAVLATLAGLLMWSVLPVAIGWTPRVILSGSMEPRVHVGDVVVTREVPPETLAKGHVVTVVDPDHAGRTRTHRVVGRDAEGLFQLKGDANRQPDSARIAADKVLGVGVLRVPFVGRPAAWLREGDWVPLGATLGLLGVCAFCAFPRRRRTPQDRDGSGDAAPRGGAHRRRVRPQRKLAAAAAAAVAVSVAVAGPAQAVFKGTTVSPSNLLKAAASFYPYRTAVLADAPYLYWRLDEASGTLVNDSGSGNRDATLVTGGSAWQQDGALVSEVRSKALSVTTATVNQNASAAAPGTFSVEAWFRSTSTDGGRILGIGNATGSSPSTITDRQLYLAPNGRVMFGVGSGAGRRTIQSGSTLNDGEWHHVVGTRQTGGTGTRLYVDGALQAGSTSATGVTLQTAYWRAGAEQMTGWPGNPSSTYFNGHLDELAVYTKALTAARVSAHYNAGATP